MGQEPFDIKDMFSKAMSRFNVSGGSGGMKFSGLNYNPEELSEIVNEKKIEVISILIIVIAIFGAYQIYTNRLKEVGGIDLQIQSLQEKAGPAKEYQSVLDENKKTLSSLPPPMAENKMISELAAWANQRGVRVLSFEPPETKTGSFYIQSSIRMSCTANSFQSALLFLSDIERSKYALKVDSWNSTVDRSNVQQNAFFDNKTGSFSNIQTTSPRVNVNLLVITTELIEKTEDVKKK